MTDAKEEKQKLQEQIERYNDFAEELNTKIMEISVVISSLKDISKVKTKRKMLVPLANGIFLKAELESNSDLIVNVGSDVCVHKTIPETIVILKQRLNEVNKQREDVLQIMQQLIDFFENFDEVKNV